jgi:ATP-binding cassette subfamily B (MDR/TAP) protein 1
MADDDMPNIQIGRLLKRNQPEAAFIAVGCLASCFVAAIMPIYAILFGKILGVLGYKDDNGGWDTVRSRSDSVFYALLLVLLAFFTALSQLLQGWMFGLSGENLTKRLRRDAFQAMLKQEIGWFDQPGNSTGSLCARLSGDAGKVQGATGARVGTVLQAIFSMLIAIIVAVYYQWKLGLVGALIFPIMVGACFANQKIVNGVDCVEKTAFEASAKVK